MFPSEAEPLDLGSQAGAWKLIFKLLVTRLEPSNADPEALLHVSKRGRASRFRFPGWSLEVNFIILQSAEAEIVCIGAVATADSYYSYWCCFHC
jgi:hypothetical protein